jgi:3-methyladenine DNA glycosylase AlkC
MPEPLKNVYNPRFFEVFTAIIKHAQPQFNKQHFLNSIFDSTWEAKELKQRIRHIATVLNHHLPGSYPEQVEHIIQLIRLLERNGISGGFEYLFLPDFIEQYGLSDFQTSLNAMERITQFVSCEFAIRPFLIMNQNTVMKQMLEWSLHHHPHVRRLSSEGCRPRLPWAMAIPFLKKDPVPILPILENLKADESLFVRKSVANNLNDIAKDNPDVVVTLVKTWKGREPGTDWIIKHGCRTLLKKADKSAYRLFGLNGKTGCQISHLKLNSPKLKIGDRLLFSFNFEPIIKRESKFRIEYAVYYVKANGTQRRKIFKLSESSYKPGKIYPIKKEQRFQDFTTRKHYPGKHKLAIVVNGQELAVKEFVLQ